MVSLTQKNSGPIVDSSSGSTSTDSTSHVPGDYQGDTEGVDPHGRSGAFYGSKQSGFFSGSSSNQQLKHVTHLLKNITYKGE